MLSAYNHHQSTPSTTWTIPHNLNTSAVNIDVQVETNGVHEKIFPDNITSPDDNSIIVSFTLAYVGYARVVGTSS